MGVESGLCRPPLHMNQIVSYRGMAGMLQRDIVQRGRVDEFFLS